MYNKLDDWEQVPEDQLLYTYAIKTSLMEFPIHLINEMLVWGWCKILLKLSKKIGEATLLMTWVVKDNFLYSERHGYHFNIVAFLVSGGIKYMWFYRFLKFKHLFNLFNCMNECVCMVQCMVQGCAVSHMSSLSVWVSSRFFSFPSWSKIC